jgi:hypothetical protein
MSRILSVEKGIDVQSYMQTITAPLLMTEMSHMRYCDRFSKNVCRTRALVDDFYLCQTNRTDCEHAFLLGMSYLCRSLERREYSNQSS